MPEFTLRRAQALRPHVEEIAEQQVAALLRDGGRGDLMQRYAVPLASRVVCGLLGVPYRDAGFFISRSETILSRDASEAAQKSAYEEVLDYFDRAVAVKERSPGDDLLSRLIGRMHEHGDYDRDTVVGVGRLLIVAGHEATPSMIGLGTIGLLEKPALRAQALSDPALMTRTVDELLRYYSISDQSTFRVARADMRIGQVLIRAGEGVIALNASANRDESVYARPHDLDIDANTARHLAFGFGHHQCIAQHIARMNLEVAYSELFTRVPGLRLDAPVEDLRYKDDQLVHGLYELPVAW